MYNIFNEKLPNGTLKPEICQSCKDSGNIRRGECSKCLEHQAYNKNYLETHSFIYDTGYRSYHTCDHADIKSLPLRLPNEHPYLYYGIELEISFDEDIIEASEYDEYYDEYEPSDNLDPILEEFSRITDGLFVYEEDSSLCNGVELISRPCSYAYWTHPDTVEKLKKGLEYLTDNGAYVKQPDGNGFHIHISRKFMDNYDRGDRKYSTYEDFEWAFDEFQEEIEKLGGRKYTGYCASKKERLRQRLRGYAGDNEYKFDIKGVLKKGGELRHDDHGSAVIISGPTLEARVFRSTTDPEQVLAMIELVRNIAHASRDGSMENTTFDAILHTKDNLYLDKVIQKTRLANKNKLALDKSTTEELGVE